MGKLSDHVRNNVVAYLALFAALSGTAWAATELDKNEVKSKHIGKGQVKNSDLAANSVTSPKVADGSLLSEDFAPGQLQPGPQGLQGEQGQQGLQGEQGPQGSSAASSFSGGGHVGGADSDGDNHFCGPTTVLAGNNPCLTAEATQLHAVSAISPNATIVLRDLFVKTGTVSGTGGSRTFTLRVENPATAISSDTAVSCTIAGATQTTCNSGGATATIQPGSRILLHVHSESVAGGPFWFGWRATTP